LLGWKTDSQDLPFAGAKEKMWQAAFKKHIRDVGLRHLALTFLVPKSPPLPWRARERRALEKARNIEKRGFSRFYWGG
jgi:hypothetical protein